MGQIQPMIPMAIRIGGSGGYSRQLHRHPDYRPLGVDPRFRRSFSVRLRARAGA
ncbi:hypothetical protein MB901379_01066 [Mycobacterium basiliense]|uniref:Uncharacterized protein n=1 Tax=Mycobacterium basiliense TaxID=2094119 RepID=A0A3S4C9L3_9MYCO|nr:hypothetical protein MB901379_01066 [Mycobacterium basiliense]